MDLIVLSIAIIGGLAAYIYFKQQEKKKNTVIDHAAISAKTAQDFINVKDLGDKCLYTIDGYTFAYIRIHGVSLELYSTNELKQTSRDIASGLSKLTEPWKYISVSRPVDVQRTLQLYNELYSQASGGKRALLKHEMLELADMVERGDTLERQHYIIIWGKGESEKNIVKRAQEIAKIFSSAKISAEILDKSGIAELCNLVNIPAYVHLENGIEAELSDTAMAIIKR